MKRQWSRPLCKRRKFILNTAAWFCVIGGAAGFFLSNLAQADGLGRRTTAGEVASVVLLLAGGFLLKTSAPGEKHKKPAREAWSGPRFWLWSHGALLLLLVCGLVYSSVEDYRRYTTHADFVDLRNALIKWGCAAALVAVYGGIALGAYREKRRAKRTSRFDRCRECGYLLRGLPSDRCPECGTPFNPHLTRIATKNGEDPRRGGETDTGT